MNLVKRLKTKETEGEGEPRKRRGKKLAGHKVFWPPCVVYVTAYPTKKDKIGPKAKEIFGGGKQEKPCSVILERTGSN